MPEGRGRLASNLLLAVLAVGPFIFGCVEPWSRSLLELVWLGLAVAALLRPSAGTGIPPVAVSALLVAGLGWLQVRDIHSAAEAVTGVSTVSGWATAREAMLWAVYACVAWTAARLASNWVTFRRLLWTVFLAGTAFAAIGITQEGSGTPYIYGLRAIPRGLHPFGPYFYQNHAGGLLAMSIFAGAGLVLARWSGYEGKRTLGALSNFWAEQSLLIGCLVLQGWGVWVSESRGAFHSLMMGTAAMGAMGVALFARRGTRRYWITGFGLAGMAYFTLVIWFPRLADISEKGMLGGSMSARMVIWEDTAEMIRQRPWWGFGLGAFPYAFPAFQEAGGPLGGIVEHAHGDWLELAATGGFVGLALFALGVLLQFIRGLRAWNACRDPGGRWLIAGALGAGVTLVIHGTMEMSFQSPASAVIFLSLLCAVPWPALSVPAGPEKPWKKAARLGALAVLAIGIWAAFGPLRGAWLASRGTGEDLGLRANSLEAALRSDPGNPRTYRELSVTYLWLGEDRTAGRLLLASRALRTAEAGLKVTPDHSGLWEVKGIALTWLGRRPEAWTALERAKELAPWKMARKGAVKPLKTSLTGGGRK